MILEVTLYLAAVDIECDDRARVEIVARPLIAEPRGGVAGAPESEIGLGVIGSGDPDRAAAALVVIAACRPGLAAGLARRGHRVGLPERLAGLRIIRSKESTDAQLAAGRADHDLAVDHERRERHV